MSICTFDYRDLDPEERGYVKEREELIRETAKRTAQAIIKIGSPKGRRGCLAGSGCPG